MICPWFYPRLSERLTVQEAVSLKQSHSFLVVSMRKSVLTSLIVGFLLLAAPAVLRASDWQLIGPEGGDVRSLAYDPGNPNRILLGTSAGQLFESLNDGKSWATFAHLGPADDYVLDHIVFDATH